MSDIAFYPARQFGVGPDRVPGDMKPLWNWHTGLANASLPQRREYNQALAQVIFYMKRYCPRYGFIVSERELVAIKRVDDNGNLLLSAPVRWDTQGTKAQCRLMLYLALWYLGQLASPGHGDDRWWI